MAIKFKEIRKFLARNTRLSICFEDGDYHNYLLISDIPSLEYDELYVYGVGMTDVEFSLDIYSDIRNFLDLAFSEGLLFSYFITSKVSLLLLQYSIK